MRPVLRRCGWGTTAGSRSGRAALALVGTLLACSGEPSTPAEGPGPGDPTPSDTTAQDLDLAALWGTSTGTSPGRVVLLGVDGLDLGHVARLQARGELPALQRIAEEGVVAELTVGQPLVSPRIWTELASGYPDSVTGIGDWVLPDGTPLRATDVRVERVWDAASAAGLRSLVAGWLLTTPVSEVNGLILSDEFVLRGSLSTAADAEISRDRSVQLGWLVHPLDATSRLGAFKPEERWARELPLAYQLEVYNHLQHPLVRDETHLRALEAAAAPGGPELAVAYLSGVDQLSHQYWPFADPVGQAMMREAPLARQQTRKHLAQQHPGDRLLPLSDGPVTEEMIAEGERWVSDYYRYVDARVGDLLEAMDPATTTFFLVSDHGFQTTSAPGAPLLTLHREPAAFMAWGKGVRAGATPREALVSEDLAPTIYALLGLPAAADMPGRALDELVALEPLEPVQTRVRTVPPALPGGPLPQDHPLRAQLEALGYIDAEGLPIAQPEPGREGAIPVPPPMDGDAPPPPGEEPYAPPPGEGPPRTEGPPSGGP